MRACAQARHITYLTYTTNAATIFSSDSGRFNEYKQTYAHTAKCAKCKFILGAVYLEAFETSDDQRPYPCAKLTGPREQQGTDAILNSVVLSGSKMVVDAAVSRLSQKGGYHAKQRVSAATYDLVQDNDALAAKLEALKLSSDHRWMELAQGIETEEKVRQTQIYIIGQR